jgi:aconitate hydratase
MALLQFLTTGLPAVRTPTTIHCDHLIVAKDGVETDLPNAALSNKEVYDVRSCGAIPVPINDGSRPLQFMASVCAKHDMGFYAPNAGIIHQASAPTFVSNICADGFRLCWRIMASAEYATYWY